jgi:hypothetical protein
MTFTFDLEILYTFFPLMTVIKCAKLYNPGTYSSIYPTYNIFFYEVML